jgi:hypothetical protein
MCRKWEFDEVGVLLLRQEIFCRLRLVSTAGAYRALPPGVN